jgi:pimeloyl-ACP methyl ester carboxylesterase
MKKTIIYDVNELIKESPLKDWGKFIGLKGRKVFVVEKGHGESVILLNGIAASVYTWRKVFPVLSDEFHVYSFDYKGTGLSDKQNSEYSIDEFSKELLELMDYYKINKTILVGNSLGGEVCLDFAIKHPEKVKGLILIDTAGYQYNKEITAFFVRLSRFKPVGELIKRHASKRFVKILIRGALYNDSLIDKDMINGYYKPMRTEGAFEALIELIKNLSYTEFDYDRVKEITSPTLIIWGKEDKVISVYDAYKFHKDINNSKLVIMENCGHAPQEEKPEEVSRLIKEFIEEMSNGMS